MKYFTLDDWINDQRLENFEKINGEYIQTKYSYEKYVKTIKSRLPLDFIKLLEQVCIHDGDLRYLQYDKDSDILVLRILAGDITMSKSLIVELNYIDIICIMSIANQQKGLPGPFGYGDIGMDEIELLSDHTFEHRILFSSGIELRIQFENFKLKFLDNLCNNDK